MVRTERDGELLVVTLAAGENRFNPDSLAAINEALEQAEFEEDRASVLITGEGKFFSNGLDLDWMGRVGPAEAAAVVEQTMRLLARILTFPLPVAAAINGHCFAAGAMLALACDLRVMRTERGYFCLPEADINLPFTPGMSALVRSRLTAQTAHEAMLTGRRYTAEQALEAGIVQAAVPEQQVKNDAAERLAAYAGKNHDVVAAIKQESYSHVAEKLRLPLAT